jgi:hypothetical protein
MKIVRVVFTLTQDGREYFFDRQHDETKSDQENCDAVLQHVIDCIKESNPIACVAIIDKDNNRATFINTRNVLELFIKTVAVYLTDTAPVNSGEGELTQQLGLQHVEQPLPEGEVKTE